MKKRVLILFVVIFALVGLVVALPMASATPAIVINDSGCGLLDGDGGVVSATSDHTVLTNNARGNTVLICKVKGVANSTGKAVHYDNASTDLVCGTFGGLTTHWHETVSASGNATLVCLVP